MKKALSFAVALGLVAGMASSAMAEDMLSIKGDARWRGVYKQNTTDSDDNAADKKQYMDQRYRLKAEIKINDDVKVNTRLVLRDSEFGNENGSRHDVDRANMTINALGGSWIIGRQDASWGNKFLAYGIAVDRIKAVYKSGDLTYGGYIQKSLEGSDINGAAPAANAVFGDGDKDVYAGFIVGKAGNAKWGVLANYLYNDNQADNGQSQDGYLIDPFFTVKAGAATILGELVYTGGDAGENRDNDPVYGGFIGGAVGMDALTVKGLVAYYKNNEGGALGAAGRDCDNDFAPSLLIGTCNETAVIDFGATTNPNDTVAQADDSTYLVGAGVDFKVNDKLTVGALIGYLMASEYGGTNQDEDKTLVEYDLTAKYQLAQNASYHIGVAYADVDKFSTADDGWWVIGNGIDVKW